MAFKKTHRLLVKAVEGDYGYYTVEIDINSGLFRKAEVNSNDTIIRVKSEVYGEQLCAGSNVPLSMEDIELLEAKFNSVRGDKGWDSITFRRAEEVENEVSSTSEVQGQEEA